MAESATSLLKRHAALKAQAGPYWQVCQEIAERVVPHKSDITVTREPGADKTDVLYDSTAIDACRTLAAMIHGTMTPSTQPWISFVMREDTLNEDQSVREWLEDVSVRLHKALRQANFNSAVHELYWDLCAFGTGCMLIEEKEADPTGRFTGFRFTTVAVGKFVLTEDKDGRADGCWRDVVLSRRAVLEQFGADAVGADFVAKSKGKLDEMITVVHAVYPRRDRVYDQATGRPKAARTNLPWVSCYALQEPKKILSESGYEEFPYVIPRWNKTTGEVYGTGPSHTALPDIKTLNAFVMFILQAVPMAMQPPTMERSDSVVGDPDLTPAGRNVVDASGPIGEAFAFMDTKYRPDIAADFRAQWSESIRQMYHIQEVRPLPDSPNRTATEQAIRYELSQRLLGPTTGRLESELLNPGTWRCFALMARRQAFRPLPGVLQQAAGEGSSAADLDVEYEGPLARAQRTVEITAQDRVVAFVVGYATAIAAISPAAAQAALDILKIDKMTRDRQAITGLTADSLASDEEMQGIRDARAQAAAQQQRLDSIVKATEAARNTAPMMTALQKPGQGKAA